jgi:hypothetical protein
MLLRAHWARCTSPVTVNLLCMNMCPSQHIRHWSQCHRPRQRRMCHCRRHPVHAGLHAARPPMQACPPQPSGGISSTWTCDTFCGKTQSTCLMHCWWRHQPSRTMDTTIQPMPCQHRVRVTSFSGQRNNCAGVCPLRCQQLFSESNNIAPRVCMIHPNMP